MKIEKHLLVAALNKVRGTVANSKMVELLRCFCFKDNRIYTYDGVSGTVTAFPLELANFAIPADKFWRVVNSLFQDIDITITANQVVLQSGGNKTKLGIMPTHGFPEIIPNNLELFSDAPNFVECLEKVAFCIGVNATKPHFMGVGVKGDYVYAGDGRRFARAKLSKPTAGSLSIPGPAVEHIVRLGQPDYAYTAGGSQIGVLIKSTSTVFTTSVLAHEMPFQALDGMFATPRIEVQFPNETADAILRVSQLAGEESALHVQSTGEQLLLTCETSEVGDAKEAIDWACPHKFDYWIRSEYMKEGFQRSSLVDIADVIEGGQRRKVGFYADGFEHFAALLSK